MRNIKLTIEYDGTNYCGWQVQPNGITVQEVIEKAIAKMTGKKTRITGASRTDSGVHAFGQVANFTTASKISCEGFLMGLNSMLPDDVAIKKVEDVPEDFHSKRKAKGKHYRYLIYSSTSKPAILKDRVWHIRTPLDLKRIKKNAGPLIGVHDYSSFCASGDTNKSKVREIKKIGCSLTEDGLIAIDIVGTGFLKYMVRNIVGTLVGSPSPKEIKKILAARDRKCAGITAPACGLYLIQVFY